MEMARRLVPEIVIAELSDGAIESYTAYHLGDRVESPKKNKTGSIV